MKFLNDKTCAALLLGIWMVCFAPAVFAQDDATPAPPQQSDQGAAPAATAPPEVNVENPPLSGLDEPQAEPAYGGRSYLIPGLQFSESASSNPAGSTNKNTSVSEVSRGLGSLDLQKLWKRSQLGMDYIGGDLYYAGPGFATRPRNYQVHTFAADERILWRTGQLAFRDSFNYLPQGSFGFNSFGGAGSFGALLGGGVTGAGAGTGLGAGMGGGANGSLSSPTFGGNQPRISNTGIVDVVQEISPRSSITMAAAYDMTHFMNTSTSTIPVINSQMATGQIGYNRILSRKDQVGVMYSFDELHFPIPNSGTVEAHVVNGMYGHRITGRLNFVVAGGPQIIQINNPPGSPAFLVFGPTSRRVSGNGRVVFHYMVTARTNAQVLYTHSITPGSGFLAGANSDAVRLSLSRVLGRRWTLTTDGGYSHHSAIQTSLLGVGLNANSYQYWYSGASLRRQLGQHFGAFMTYQFDDFGAGRCSGSGGSTAACGQAAQQHVGLIGFDWHPRPLRLD